MTEEFLDGADVVAGFEQVGGEGVAEGVGTDGFDDPGGFGSGAHGLLHGTFVEVVAAQEAAAGIFGYPVGREDILPPPLRAGVGVFARQRVGEIDAAGAACQIFHVPLLHL